jgi:sugar fermentation stimulation protein A
MDTVIEEENYNFSKACYFFHKPIVCEFIRREKRFFSFFKTLANEEIVAHCVNTGLMKGLLIAGSKGVLSSKNTGNLLYTWEAICIDSTYIGVNTFTPNKLVEKLLENNLLEEVKGEVFKKERLIKELKYKPDFSNENTIIECKNVHLIENNVAHFPDCITERGSRQMEALIHLKKQGKRCIVIYILQRDDTEILSVHPSMDLLYLQKTKEAQKAGVEFIAFNCLVNEMKVLIKKRISYKLS